MKKVSHLRTNENQAESQDPTEIDDLDQVRELLFGGAVRDIEKQRDSLQKEVNQGFAESDRQTNKRLDELSRRIDELKSSLGDEKKLVDQKMAAESTRVDNAFAQHRKDLETATSKQQAELEVSVASERLRLAEALRNLASVVARKND